ncbi:hypothetical protein CD29_06900 [Ureibacillus manganicus DSM 26584]|uniref:Uncharacterized protein n=1 Tax=Ureibacillus manganicus DSM 26584 TaxID=1384049 RepID=A0A0A3I7C7_9BACL|nr:hypothetical protein CD29_06900 [Ureibacillus manganicus DSM 26584]
MRFKVPKMFLYVIEVVGKSNEISSFNYPYSTKFDYFQGNISNNHYCLSNVPESSKANTKRVDTSNEGRQREVYERVIITNEIFPFLEQLLSNIPRVNEQQ